MPSQLIGTVWALLGLFTGEATYMFQELVILPLNREYGCGETTFLLIKT